LNSANWLSVIVVLAASLLAFSGLGIPSASYLLLFKRGNPAKWLLIGLWGIAGGMLFPVSTLPDWPPSIAKLNPMTHALNAMRAALLGDAAISQLLSPIGILLLFAAVLLPISIFVFPWTLTAPSPPGLFLTADSNKPEISLPEVSAQNKKGRHPKRAGLSYFHSLDFKSSFSWS